ncbi:MAG: UDP-N-acetylmuramoyl-L-alanine--D-glutamate ligase [Candidatus Eremiobacteraeota bacterium]|nr:UDP-N-acetylmuramoyl-L-alanine--D-glutamate ligase [Candidatus Eremiobacteraeota bacterium]
MIAGFERALVIGLGRSGRASAQVLRDEGAQVWATDESSSDALAPVVAELRAFGVTFVAPAEIERILPELDAAVLSPGVPLNSPLVRRVQSARVPVYSEIEVAYRLCKAPIVALTGTKGKTTTTALVGHIFRTAGRTTLVGGNIGNALIDEAARAGAGDWVVAEVSSFQLESIRSFKPKVSALINVSPDHLDRYFSMDEYVEAKFRIFANQNAGDTFVGNLDDERIVPLAEGEGAERVKCRALWFSRDPHRMSTLYQRNGAKIVYAPPTGDPRPIDVVDVADIPLRGAHNVDNVMAATLIALAAGIEVGAIRQAVRSFEALPHRLTHVAEIDGITYVDDSKATNPGAVIAALRTFEDGKIVLIAGGKAKGTDFADFGRVASSRTRAVIVLGEAAQAMSGVIKRAKVAFAESMEQAVEQASEFAKKGDVVLLSPGCASFDMFASAEARGDAFVAAVQRLQRGTEAVH